MMNGTVRIEFQIVDGQLKLMVHAPMASQEEKDLTCQILAQAIPVVINYQSSVLIKPHGNGTPAKLAPIPPAPLKQ